MSKPPALKSTSSTDSTSSTGNISGASAHARPSVSFRMRIRHEDHVALGPGKVDLLEAVRDHGSISAAARSLNMSYRRAWLLLDELNSLLKSPATLSAQGGHTGGGCVLTPVGEEIVRLYRDIEVQAFDHCKIQINTLTKLIKR